MNMVINSDFEGYLCNGVYVLVRLEMTLIGIWKKHWLTLLGVPPVKIITMSG